MYIRNVNICRAECIIHGVNPSRGYKIHDYTKFDPTLPISKWAKKLLKKKCKRNQ